MARLVVRTEGVSGLYRGITPTLLGIVPYAGLKFYVYQSLKVGSSRLKPKAPALGDAGGSWWGSAFACCTASAMAS